MSGYKSSLALACNEIFNLFKGEIEKRQGKFTTADAIYLRWRIHGYNSLFCSELFNLPEKSIEIYCRERLSEDYHLQENDRINELVRSLFHYQQGGRHYMKKYKVSKARKAA